MNYEDWWLDHPVIAAVILIAGAVAGAALGVGAAYITTAMHLVAPDNIAAGSGMGFGGVLFGTAVSALIVLYRNRKAQ